MRMHFNSLVGFSKQKLDSGNLLKHFLFKAWICFLYSQINGFDLRKSSCAMAAGEHEKHHSLVLDQ